MTDELEIECEIFFDLDEGTLESRYSEIERIANEHGATSERRDLNFAGSENASICYQISQDVYSFTGKVLRLGYIRNMEIEVI